MLLDKNIIRYKLFKRRLIDPITNCWLWKGCKNKAGYGQIVLVFAPHIKKQYDVHRLSAYVFLNLDITNSHEYSCHKDSVCKNKHCFNPDHLYIGNTITNGNDRRNSTTHCPNGHEYTILSIGFWMSTRYCKICKNIKKEKIK